MIRREELKLVAEQLRLRPNHRVLEIGCGSGFYWKKLSALSHAWLGIDNCSEMISAARSVGANVLLGELLPLYKSDVIRCDFDRILLAGCLEFFENSESLSKTLNCSITLAKANQGRLVILSPKTGLFGFLYRAAKALAGCPTLPISTIELAISQLPRPQSIQNSLISQVRMWDFYDPTK